MTTSNKTLQNAMIKEKGKATKMKERSSAAKLLNKVPVYIRDKNTLAAFRSSLDHIHLV